MNTTKKLFTCLVLLVLVLSIKNVNAEEYNFVTLPITQINNSSECTKAYTYKKSLDMSEDDVVQYTYGTFTISKNSILQINYKALNSTLGENPTMSNFLHTLIEIYTDEELTNRVFFKSFNGDVSGNILATLDKGTYYVRMKTTRTSGGYYYYKEDKVWNLTYWMYVIPTSKALKLSYTVSGDSVKIKAKCNILDWIKNCNYSETSATNYKDASLNECNTTSKFDPNGYTTIILKKYNNIIFILSNTNAQRQYYSGRIVLSIDRTAPKVSGVANNKTYKKAVTIKFSDSSGIKKATLNKKEIKSGKKVSKKGTYTLKVVDIHNNTKTIKFKIK